MVLWLEPVNSEFVERREPLSPNSVYELSPSPAMALTAASTYELSFTFPMLLPRLARGMRSVNRSIC